MTLSTLMMPAVFLLMLVFGNSVQSAPSLHLKFQFGGEWINAGDADLQAIFYSQAYNHFDASGGLYQYTASGFTKNACAGGGMVPPLSPPTPDISFVASGIGEYGDDKDSKLSVWDFRDLLIHAMWEGVQKVTNPTGYSVIVPVVTGRCKYASQTCPDTVSRCAAQHWGHNVPSLMRVNVYDDHGNLRTERFEVKLSDYKVGTTEACSNLGKSFIIGLGLIPEIGGLVSSEMFVHCLMG